MSILTRPVIRVADKFLSKAPSYYRPLANAAKVIAEDVATRSGGIFRAGSKMGSVSRHAIVGGVAGGLLGGGGAYYDGGNSRSIMRGTLRGAAYGAGIGAGFGLGRGVFRSARGGAIRSYAGAARARMAGMATRASENMDLAILANRERTAGAYLL